MRLFQLLAIALLFIQCSLNIPDAVVIEMENLPEKVDYNYHIKPILSDSGATNAMVPTKKPEKRV